MSAVQLSRALRQEAEKIANVRDELRSTDEPRDDRLYPDLNNAAELVRVLARIIEGKSIQEAFGAPGDFGYQTALGSGLANYYSST